MFSKVLCVATFDLFAAALCHQVFDTNVGKTASSHDSVVSTTATKTVELRGLNSLADQVLTGWLVGVIAPAGEMWSVVTESPKIPSGRASSMFWPSVAGVREKTVKKWWQLDIRRLVVP